MNWRNEIKKIGGAKVALDMGVKYPTVSRYFRPGTKTFPKGMMKPLCSTVKKYLTDKEFEEFLNSMAKDFMSAA